MLKGVKSSFCFIRCMNNDVSVIDTFVGVHTFVVTHTFLCLHNVVLLEKVLQHKSHLYSTGSWDTQEFFCFSCFIFVSFICFAVNKCRV